MTKKRFFVALVALIIVAIVLFGVVASKKPTPPQPKPFVSAPLNEPGIYSCAQCVGGRNCAQATCNLSCEYFASACQTIVAGFMSSEIEGQGKATDEPVFSGVPGVPLRTVRADLAALGVETGMVLTHINHEYIGGNLERFAELSSSLKKGDVLTVWRNNERKDIKL